MALARTAKWTQATQQANVKPCILVSLTLGGAVYQYCWASQPMHFNGSQLATANIVEEVSGIGYRVEPLTRKVSLSEVTLVLRGDKRVRELFAANRVFGQAVSLTWADESLAQSAGVDFQGLWSGMVTECVATEDTIILTCHDTFILMSGDVSNYSAVNKHPLEICLDLLAIGLGGRTFGIQEVSHPNSAGVPGDSWLYTPGNYYNQGLPGVPVGLVNVATFDPDNYSTGTYPISHWNTCRAIHDGADRHISSGQKLGDALDELSVLLGGIIFCDELGAIRYNHYDPGAPSADIWTIADVGKVQQDRNSGNLVNHAVCRTDWDGTTQAMSITQRRRGDPTLVTNTRRVIGDSDGSNSGFQVAIVRDDIASQINYAFPGTAGRVVSEHVETKWLGVKAGSYGGGNTNGTQYPTGILATSQPGDYITVNGGWITGFCGVNRMHNGNITNGVITGVPDGRTKFGPTNDRLIYLLIDNEIIACNAAYPGPEIYVSYADPNKQSDQWASNAVPGSTASWNFVISQRGALGTTPAVHGGVPGVTTDNPVRDITIATAVVKRWLDRFSDGVPTISVETKLSKAFLQIGDLVSLSNDVVLSSGLNGVTSRTQWEIIGKTPNLTSQTPCIMFVLALARTPPVYANNYFPPGLPSNGIAVAGGLIGTNDWKTGSLAGAGAGATNSGVIIPAVSIAAPAINGLNIALPAGTASTPNNITAIPAVTIPVDPNMDHYIVYDHGSKSMIKKSVATNAAQPAIGANQTLQGIYAAGATTAVATFLASGPKVIGAATAFSPPPSDGIPMAWLFDRATTNFIQNPSFEKNNTDGWTLFANGSTATFARDTSTFWWGIACAKFVTGTGGVQRSFFSNSTPTVSGVPWVASAEVAWDTPGVAMFHMQLEFLDINGAVTDSIDKIYGGAAFGSRVFVQGQSASGSTVAVRFKFMSALDNHTVFIDGVQLEQKQSWSTTYCDGSLGPGYAWTGVPHNSSSTRTNGWNNVGGIDSAIGRPMYMVDDGNVWVQYILNVGNSADGYFEITAGGASGGTGSDGGLSITARGTGNDATGLSVNDIRIRPLTGKITFGASGLYYGAATSMTQNLFIAPLNATKEWEYFVGAGSNYATGTGILTIPEAGVYWIFAGWRIAGSSGKEFVMELRLNGASIFDSPDFFDGAGAGGLAQEMCCPWLFAKNDTVQIKCFNGGVTSNLDGSRANYFGWMRAH